MLFSVIWPLAKVFAVFLIMVGLMRAKLALELTMLSGSAILGVFFLMPPLKWGQAVLAGLSDPNGLFLAAIVGFVLVLSDVLDRTGQNARLMRILSVRLTRTRFKLAFFPALIGLLPMPGGAYFSAPMVKESADGNDLSGAELAMLNYWFRHIWELVWPLYPVLILSCYLVSVPMGRLLLHSWPCLAVVLGLGWYFYLRPRILRLDASRFHPAPVTAESSGLAGTAAPLLIALLGSLGLELAVSAYLPGIPTETGFLTALILAIVVCLIQNRVPPSKLVGMLLQKHVAKMLMLVLSIFIFKSVLGQSGVIEELGRNSGSQTALFLVATILPFTVGLISGVSMSFAGAVLPLVLGILTQMDMLGLKMPYMILVLFSGFTGVMASPLHVCLVLSCQFFHADLVQVWKRLAVPCAILWGFGVGYFFLLRWLYS